MSSGSAKRCSGIDLSRAALREKGVRLVQKMQVASCYILWEYSYTAEAGPTLLGQLNWYLSHFALRHRLGVPQVLPHLCQRNARRDSVGADAWSPTRLSLRSISQPLYTGCPSRSSHFFFSESDARGNPHGHRVAPALPPSPASPGSARPSTTRRRSGSRGRKRPALGGVTQSTFCMVHRKTMITMGSPYFVWINTNEIVSSWYLLDAVCVTPPACGSRGQ
jgi:hypothetical protein